MQKKQLAQEENLQHSYFKSEVNLFIKELIKL